MPTQPLAHASRRDLTVEDYYQGVRGRDIATLARALTLVESQLPRHRKLAEELMTRILPHTGNAVRVGITGVPGVGKSTFIESLGMQLVRDGKRVAVLAVDPSSGISGGSILGDKTRMPALSAQSQAYIRPSPSAGTLGGVALRTRESLLVCEAADYDVVLIETVGVGQSETMVADMTDWFLALMLPGAGDELQGIKRGLLELVDVVAVNKADGETKVAAQSAAHQIELSLRSLAARPDRRPPATVFTCSALNDEGVAEIWAEIASRQVQATADGLLAARRGKQNLRWLWHLVEQRLLAAIRADPRATALGSRLEAAVVAGTLPVETAAGQVLEAFGLRGEEDP
jgi:LAO/AO transport system kinase